MTDQQLRMTAIVLAGQRDGEDELAQHAGVDCKAFVEIGGKAMLLRVLDTLRSSPCVGDIFVSGPDKEKLQQQALIETRIRSGEISWVPPENSPSASAYEVLRQLPAADHVLLTTADHPLLTAAIVNEFCEKSSDKKADLVVGFAPYALVKEKFPTMKKTVTRLKGDAYCGCNLFAFLTPQSREAAKFWQRLEAERKNPFHLIRFLGWMSVIKYLLRRLTLQDALDTLSARLGLRLAAVILSDGDAAVDVDSVSDFEIVRKRFSP